MKVGGWNIAVVFILVRFWFEIDCVTFLATLVVVIMERAARVVHHLYDSDGHNEYLGEQGRRSEDDMERDSKLLPGADLELNKVKRKLRYREMVAT